MASRPTSEPHPELELGTLRRIVRGGPDQPGLVDVLPRLQQAHRKELVRIERWMAGDLARHPHPRELIRSRRRQGNLDEHGRLKRVFDARRVMTEDVHENRVVRHAVNELRARLVAATHGKAEASELLRELDAAVAQAPFLHAVTDLRGVPGQPTATLSVDPLYRSVFQGWLALRHA